MRGQKARRLNFQLGMDEKPRLLRSAYVETLFAADLTAFDVALMAACGFIDNGLVPFAAARTL
jgi:hypothetical protein